MEGQQGAKVASVKKVAEKPSNPDFRVCESDGPFGGKATVSTLQIQWHWSSEVSV